MLWLASLLGLSTTRELRLALCGVVLAAIGAWMAYERFHLIDEGEARQLAKMKVSSDKLLATAQANIVKETEAHAADVAANQVKLDEQLKANSVLSDALNKRVRDFDAYRRQHPALAGSPGGPSSASPGECGAISCGDLASQSLQDSDELARSVGELRAVLQSAQRERDSLIGIQK